MKKVVILLMACVLLTEGLRSQTQEIYTVQSENSVNRTIVRCYGNSYSITYIETESRHYFCLLNHSVSNPSTAEMAIEPTYSVNDFVVWNDSVFFCGDDAGTGSAFVGAFYIPAFFTANGQYDIQLVSDSYPDYYATTLTSMTVCSAKGSTTETHVLCIGESSGGLSCLVDVYADKSKCGWSIMMRETSSTTEEWKDIVTTKNYVVVVGYVTAAPYRYICMRQLDRAALSTNSLFDILVTYGGTSTYTWNWQDLLAATEESTDYIYTAAYYWDNLSSHPEGIQIAKYDVFAMSSAITNSMISFNNWKISNMSSLSKLRELSYDSPKNTIVLLNDAYDTSSILRNAIFEVPVSIANPVDASFFDNYTFQSLDINGSSTYYISTGQNIMGYLSYNRKALGNYTTGCENIFQFNIYNLTCILNSFSLAPVGIETKTICFISKPINSYQFNTLSTDCQQ